MSVSGFHVRRPGEYIRPPRQLVLHREYPEPEGRPFRFLSGVAFQRDPFTGNFRGGSIVDLELVPERFNVHDVEAVAADYGGMRVGYLAAGAAVRLHDILLAANTAGFAVWTQGRLDSVDLGDGLQLAPAVSLPGIHLTSKLIKRFNLDAVVMRLLDALDDTVRAELIESAWEPIPPAVVRQVAGRAAGFPELTWPSSPPKGVPPRTGLPGLLTHVLRDMVVAERKRAAETRAHAVVQRRAERLRLKEEERAQRVAAKEQAKRERVDQVRAGLEQGWTNREIADRLGLSTAVVQSLQRQLPNNPRPDHNNVELIARLRRAQAALALQADGHSLKEIAQRLHVSKETVEGMLRDAKFKANPDSDPARLTAANAAADAQRAGTTRDQFAAAAGASAKKAAEAWRDAKILAAAEQPPSG